MREVINFSTGTTVLAASGEWVPEAIGLYFLTVTLGAGYWIGGPGTCPLECGSALVVAGGSQGRLMAVRDSEMTLQWFVVVPEYLSDLLTVDERLALRELGAAGSLARCFEAHHEVARRGSALLAEEGRVTMLTRIRLLELILSVVSPEIKAVPRVGLHDDARERLRQWLGRHPESEIINTSVENLAAQTGCSVRHLSRIFTEEMGVSFRERQTELRLLRARELLTKSNAKIIDVAYESGYRHLGLFNSLFRRRFGQTPSAWRREAQKSPKKRVRRSPRAELGLLTALFLLGASVASGSVEAADGPTPPPAAIPNSNPNSNSKPNSVSGSPAAQAPSRPLIRELTVSGNTLLSEDALHAILSDYKGRVLDTNSVAEAMKSLQLAYQGRGFATVSVTLPKQRITNGVVQLAVIEGVLSEIRIQGNRWFSEGNVRRALPDLHTNIILNSRIFQQELNNANNNQDRQIYPAIEPGATPGTTRLILKVKDQVPVHGRFELNNQYTPGTPELRGNASAQYNNLWQREHSVGLQYGFALQEFKDPAHSSLLDRPLIANYSGYYRLPLSSDEPVQSAIDANPRKFGYNEATRQFVLPPSQGRTELTIYANRSTTDTGVKVNPVETINPPPIGLYSQASGQDVSTTEAVGFRISKPLPPFLEVQSTLSLGADVKNFQRASFNTNNFLEQFTFLNPDTLATQTNSLPFSNTQPPRTANISYLPVAVRWDGARADTNGTTTLGMGLNFNFAGGPFSDRADFINTTGTTNASGSYVTVLGSASRQQKLPGDWTLLVKADGQWANEPLISNEQLGMGGLAGVRGYLEGERYGDTGWRLTLEPRTPLVDVGMVDGTMPLRFQGAFFMDYGRSYSLNPNALVHLQSLWGAGMGINAKIGATFDFRVAVAWALTDAQTTHAGALQVYFAIAAQF